MIEMRAQLQAVEMTLTVVLALLTATNKAALGRLHQTLQGLVSEAATNMAAANADRFSVDLLERFEALAGLKLDQIFANAKNIR